MRISIDDVWCGRAIGLDWHGLGFGFGFAIGIGIGTGLSWLGFGSFEARKEILGSISTSL